MASLDNLKPEPGQSRCGASFPEEITVTGLLPNGFGGKNRRTLQPVANWPSGSWWSQQSAAEAEYVAQVNDAIARFESDLGKVSYLAPTEGAKLASVIQVARSNIKKVNAIYAWWRGESGGLAKDTALSGLESEWPLTASDIPGQYMPACVAGSEGQWREVKELVGSNQVKVTRWYLCPTQATVEKRQSDRWKIYSLLEQAGRAVRCAEWTLWRTELYRLSSAEFNDANGGDFAPAGPKPSGPKIVGAVGGGFKPASIDPDGPAAPRPTGPTGPKFPVPGDATIVEIPDTPPPPDPGPMDSYPTPMPGMEGAGEKPVTSYNIPIVIGMLALLGYAVTASRK